MATGTRRATNALLQKYRLVDVKETGRVFGKGSYAAVVEVEYKGLVCAAKKIHPILYEDGVGDLVGRFEGECKLLSSLRHPHVVQFVGIWFESEASLVPVLVMEFLPTTLAQCVEHYHHLPEEITYSILRDVALGLRFLHERSKPIIHRDLSANNVLLTGDMRAKISDLGVAKILRLDPKKMARMTKGPGTPSYMPPEAIKSNPSYDTNVDIFSYGVMMVHVFSGQWPEPGESVISSNTESLRAVSEADRRKKYIDAVGHDHPLMELILQCLKNWPHHRPGIAAVFHRVNSVASRLPPTFTDRIEAIKRMGEMQRMIAEKEVQSQAEIQRVIQEREAHSQAEIQRAIQEREAYHQAEIQRAIQEGEAYHQAEIQRVIQEREAHSQAEIQRVIQEREASHQAEIQRAIQEREAYHQAEIQRIIQEREAIEQEVLNQAEIQGAIELEAHRRAEIEAEIRRVTSKNLQHRAQLQAAMEREHAKDAEVELLKEDTQRLQAELQTKEAVIASKIDLLAWLDSNLQEARQRIAANHQQKEAQSDVGKTVPQQSTEQNINRLSNEVKNLQPQTEQPPLGIQAPHNVPFVAETAQPLQVPLVLPAFTANLDIEKMVSTTAENATLSSPSPIPIMATGDTVTEQPPLSSEQPRPPHMLHNRSEITFARPRPMPRSTTTESKDVSHQVQITAASECAPSVPTSHDAKNTQKEARSDEGKTASQQSTNQNINRLSKEVKNLQPQTEQPPLGIQAPHTRTVVTESAPPLQLTLPVLTAKDTENMDAAVLNEVSTTVEDATVSSPTPIPIMATGDTTTEEPPHSSEEPHLHMRLKRSKSFGMALGRPRPTPTPRTTKSKNARHQIPTSPGTVEPQMQHRSASTLPRNWRQSTAEPKVHRRSGVAIEDPKLQALLEKQSKKATEGEPSEDFKLLEESQRAKQSHSPAPALVTSELQQKLERRRRF